MRGLAGRVGELPAPRRCFGESRRRVRFAKCLIRNAGERRKPMFLLATLEVAKGQILSQISQRCHPILVAFEWGLTKETIYLPLGCLQGGILWWSSLTIRSVSLAGARCRDLLIVF